MIAASGLLQLVHLVFVLYYLVLVVRVLGSLLPPPPSYSTWGKILGVAYGLTEPLLAPIRRALAPYQRNSRLDFSPLVLLLLMSLVEDVVVRILRGLV